VSALFDGLVGQPLAVDLLEAALQQKRLAPAYLFAGPEGVGRRLAALRFLEGVLSEGVGCERARRRLEDRNHPDLVWIEPTFQHQGRLLTRDEAVEAGVNRRTPPQLRLEQIRGVRRALGRQPVESPRGMVVIESTEAMAEAAANALLKTLEEPGHGLLILLTAAPERLLSTIRSRCQLIRFVRLDRPSVAEVLRRLDAVEQDPPELLAMAAGSPGAVLEHRNRLAALPTELMPRLRHLPNEPMQALALARDVCEALDGEQQLWLINWWQQALWTSSRDVESLKRLETLRRHLLSFVQPRLAWEVALLDLTKEARSALS
jgi:DNA polymerase-3 subunit delta'